MREHVNGVSNVKRMLAGANLPAFQISSSSVVNAFDAGYDGGHHQKASEDEQVPHGNTSISGFSRSWRRRRRVIVC